MLQNQAEWNSSLTRSQTNTAVIRGLKSGTIYVFEVRARTVAGFGRFSGKMYFQTMTEGRITIRFTGQLDLGSNRNHNVRLCNYKTA